LPLKTAFFLLFHLGAEVKADSIASRRFSEKKIVFALWQ